MISTSPMPPRCGQPLFSPFHWRSPLSGQKKDGTYRRTSSHSLFRKRERQIRQRRKRHGRYLAFRFHRQAAGIFRDSFLLDRLPQRISLRLKKQVYKKAFLRDGKRNAFCFIGKKTLLLHNLIEHLKIDSLLQFPSVRL